MHEHVNLFNSWAHGWVQYCIIKSSCGAQTYMVSDHFYQFALLNSDTNAKYAPELNHFTNGALPLHSSQIYLGWGHILTKRMSVFLSFPLWHCHQLTGAFVLVPFTMLTNLCLNVPLSSCYPGQQALPIPAWVEPTRLCLAARQSQPYLI